MENETVHTHYDNLKVTRNAPVEVIKAAYRAMAQKYHPDINQSPGAERVMKIVNEAWEVLSDPVKRNLHDQWIAKEERRIATARGQSAPSDTPGKGENGSSPQTDGSTPSPYADTAAVSDPSPPTRKGDSRYVLMLVISSVAVLLYAFFDERSKVIESSASHVTLPVELPTPSELAPNASLSTVGQAQSAAIASYRSSTSAPLAPIDHRLQLARLHPGQHLPDATGYILGSQRLSMSGHSLLTIDNTGNDSDVVVKVCQANSKPCGLVRHAFIRVGDRFTFERMAPGSYDIRYASLARDGLSQSDPFELEEIVEEEGTRYSVVTLTLYTVTGGNTRMQSIDESHF